MKLFVDDNRSPLDAGFTIVRNYEKAIILIDLIDFEFVSLDFDLGEKHNGLDIIKHMINEERFPSHLNIHSTHPKGSIEMYKLAKSLFPKSVTITRNSVQ